MLAFTINFLGFLCESFNFDKPVSCTFLIMFVYTYISSLSWKRTSGQHYLFQMYSQNCFSLLPQTPTQQKLHHSFTMYGNFIAVSHAALFCCFLLLKKYLLTEEDVQVHPASHNPHEKKPFNTLLKKKGKNTSKNTQTTTKSKNACVQ